MKKLSCIAIALLIAAAFACKKASDNGGGNNPPPNPPPTPTDPPVENTIGFFLDSWTPKTFTVPSYIDTTAPSANANVFVSIDPTKIVTKIPTSEFAHNANIWMTQIVTEPALLNHIKNL